MREKKYKLVESLDGKTLEEWAQIVASDDNFCNDVEYGKKEAATSAVKALLGGEEK